MVPSLQPIQDIPEPRKRAKEGPRKPLLKKRKKTRRGGRGGKPAGNLSFKVCDSWKIFHSNIRGFDSKAVSLKSILKSINANDAMINQTNLKGNRKMKIEGYTSYNRNRLNANMGGVATCVAVREASNVLKVAEGVNDDEYIITRHVYKSNFIE